MSHPNTSPSHKTSPASSQASPLASALSLIRTHGQPDPLTVADALAALDAVPRDELPNGGARAALAEAIRRGAVDAVYPPMGARYHVLTLAWVRRDVDPRRRIAEWVEAWELAQRYRATALVMLFLDGARPSDYVDHGTGLPRMTPRLAAQDAREGGQ